MSDTGAHPVERRRARPMSPLPIVSAVEMAMAGAGARPAGRGYVASDLLRKAWRGEGRRRRPSPRPRMSAVGQLLGRHAGPALLRVLAADARRDLRDDPESGRADRLAAGLAHPVLAGPQAVERLREPVGPLHEETSHREGHLPVLADPSRVSGGLTLPLVFAGPGIVLEGDRPAQTLQAIDRARELLLQCPSDVVHGLGPPPADLVPFDAAGTRSVPSGGRRQGQVEGGAV